MYALSLSCQILLMFEAHWPMKAFLSSTCYAGRGRSQGGDVALNSLLRTCISLKHPLSCRAFHQAGRVYGQVESVFLMDLSLEKPAGAVFINPARLGFGTLFAVHSSGGGGILPIIAYMGRLCPKGVPFPGFRNMKGWGFHWLKFMKKN